MIGQPYSGKLNVRLDERREDAGDRRLPPTLHFVVIFERESDARKVMDVLPKRFGKYGLTLHPGKTRLVRFERPSRRPGQRRPDEDQPETFDFLGFTHHWGVSRKGRWYVERSTAKGRFGRALNRIREWCRQHRHDPVEEQHRALEQKLRGHCGYYGIIGNTRALARFRWEMIHVWRNWLDRRSQRARMSWDRFLRLLARYPLALPRHPARVANP